MADQLHKKMEQLHMEAVALKERARATCKKAEFVTALDRKTIRKQDKKDKLSCGQMDKPSPTLVKLGKYCTWHYAR